MTSENDDLVLSTARLARLSVEADEARALATDFDAILASFRAALDRCESSSGSALAPAQHAPPLRSDVLAASECSQAILSAAPDSADGHFRVPRAIGSAE